MPKAIRALFKLIITAALITAVTPAHAAEVPSSFDVVDGELLPVQIDESGHLFAEIAVSGNQFSVASWEREVGIWASPEEIRSDIQSFADCVLDYAQTFDTVEDFENSLGSNSNNASFGVSLESVYSAGKMLNCFQVSEYVTYALKHQGSFINGANPTRRIPLEKFGPGEHELFIQNLVSSDSAGQACPELAFKLGGLITACNPVLGKFQKVKVRIAEPSQDIAAQSQELLANDPSKWFQKSTFSKLEPIDFSNFRNFETLIGPAATIAGASIIFSVLIALPTSLLEATLEANHERVSGLLRRIVPRWMRRRISPAERADEKNGNADNV